MDEKLIELVKERKFLYDKTDDNFKKYKLKVGAWKEIGELMGMDEKKCRLKWKCLRDTFRRELRRLSAQSGNNTPSTKWKYFRKLYFLRTYNDPLLELGDYENDKSSIILDVDIGNAVQYEVCNPPATNNTENGKEDMHNLVNKCLPIQHYEEQDEISLFFRGIAASVKNAKLLPTEYMDLQIDILNMLRNKIFEKNGQKYS